MIDSNTVVIVCSGIWAGTALLSFIKDDVIVKRNYKILTDESKAKDEKIEQLKALADRQQKFILEGAKITAYIVGPLGIQAITSDQLRKIQREIENSKEADE